MKIESAFKTVYEITKLFYLSYALIEKKLFLSQVINKNKNKYFYLQIRFTLKSC